MMAEMLRSPKHRGTAPLSIEHFTIGREHSPPARAGQRRSSRRTGVALMGRMGGMRKMSHRDAWKRQLCHPFLPLLPFFPSGENRRGYARRASGRPRQGVPERRGGVTVRPGDMGNKLTGNIGYTLDWGERTGTACRRFIR